jgi:hypothetical protein
MFKINFPVKQGWQMVEEYMENIENLVAFQHCSHNCCSFKTQRAMLNLKTVSNALYASQKENLIYLFVELALMYVKSILEMTPSTKEINGFCDESYYCNV